MRIQEEGAQGSPVLRANSHLTHETTEALEQCLAHGHTMVRGSWTLNLVLSP